MQQDEGQLGAQEVCNEHALFMYCVQPRTKQNYRYDNQNNLQQDLSKYLNSGRDFNPDIALTCTSRKAYRAVYSIGKSMSIFLRVVCLLVILTTYHMQLFLVLYIITWLEIYSTGEKN